MGIRGDSSNLRDGHIAVVLIRIAQIVDGGEPPCSMLRSSLRSVGIRGRRRVSSDYAHVKSLPESGRRELVKTRLFALPVVEEFDVNRNFFAGLVTGHELVMIDEFVFKLSPE
jgi:hypothetical protein